MSSSSIVSNYKYRQYQPNSAQCSYSSDNFLRICTRKGNLSHEKRRKKEFRTKIRWLVSISIDDMKHLTSRCMECNRGERKRGGKDSKLCVDFLWFDFIPLFSLVLSIFLTFSPLFFSHFWCFFYFQFLAGCAHVCAINVYINRK